MNVNERTTWIVNDIVFKPDQRAKVSVQKKREEEDKIEEKMSFELFMELS